MEVQEVIYDDNENAFILYGNSERDTITVEYWGYDMTVDMGETIDWHTAENEEGELMDVEPWMLKLVA